MTRPIHHTFAPLADGPSVRAALAWIFRGWKGRGMERIGLKNALENRFGRTAFLFASGREALLAFLHSPHFALGDEVIIQAYTCVVVPNAIQAAGLVPVYGDIVKDTLSLDPAALEQAITPKTKAVICQHTFGIPAPLEALREICDRHGILLIEDCAHILPDASGPEGIGQYGDALLLSFGRDKAISGITGGALLIKGKMDEHFQLPPLAVAPREHEQTATELPHWTVFRLLLYPLLYAIARPVYGSVGRAFLALCKKLRLLVPIVTGEEKHGQQAETFHRIPEPCAALALRQFRQLQQINDHRRKITRMFLEACARHGWPVLHGFQSDLPLQKFPLFTKDAEKIRRELKKQNIHLYDGWTGCVVCPADVQVDQVGYRKGSDPKAEEACEEILTLPTHPGMTERDAERVIKALVPLL